MRIPLLWALMAATAAGDDLAGLVEPRRPEPEPLPPADPDEVQRLATEGTRYEILAYQHAHMLTEDQTDALLGRLDEMERRRQDEARAWAEKQAALRRAEHEAARLAAWEASPLSVRCPKCGAGKGKRCQGAKVFMNTPHPERVRALERRR